MPVAFPRLGGPSLDAGSNAAASDGVNLAANATVNTKGSWVELITATTVDTAWLLVQFIVGNANCEVLIDIGIGAAGSEIVLIPNLSGTTATATSFYMFTYVFPVQIPAGTRIAMRSQSDVSSGVSRVAVQCIAPGAAGIMGCGRHEAAGVDTANSTVKQIAVGGTANTDTAFSAGELIAATGFDWRWMNVCLTHQKNSAASVASWLVDIGVGASGSETVILSDLLLYTGTGSDTGAATFAFPVSIAAGQRIAARARCSITTVQDREVWVAVWGSG